VKRLSIQGKRIILTGASSGIGWELALQLAKSGAHVTANARRKDRLDQLIETFNSQTENGANKNGASGKIIPVVGDVCDSTVQDLLIQQCVDQFGGLDILINNAGIGAMGRFDQSAADRMRQLFEVNFFAVTELTRKSIPFLKQGNDPLIVNMSSILAHRAAPLKSEYCASKFALHGFSDSIRAELVSDGVALLLVSPSTTDSEFFDAAIEDDTGKNWKKRGSMPPEQVAAKTIRAMKKRKHEIILTHGGRLLVWLDRIVPGIANRIMARYGN
jgi:short-subunit dehydrogenase